MNKIKNCAKAAAVGTGVATTAFAGGLLAGVSLQEIRQDQKLDLMASVAIGETIPYFYFSKPDGRTVTLPMKDARSAARMLRNKDEVRLLMHMPSTGQSCLMNFDARTALNIYVTARQAEANVTPHVSLMTEGLGRVCATSFTSYAPRRAHNISGLFEEHLPSPRIEAGELAMEPLAPARIPGRI